MHAPRPTHLSPTFPRGTPRLKTLGNSRGGSDGAQERPNTGERWGLRGPRHRPMALPTEGSVQSLPQATTRTQALLHTALSSRLWGEAGCRGECSQQQLDGLSQFGLAAVPRRFPSSEGGGDHTQGPHTPPPSELCLNPSNQLLRLWPRALPGLASQGQVEQKNFTWGPPQTPPPRGPRVALTHSILFFSIQRGPPCLTPKISYPWGLGLQFLLVVSGFGGLAESQDPRNIWGIT